MQRKLAVAITAFLLPFGLWANPGPVAAWNADGSAEDSAGAYDGMLFGSASFVAGIVPGTTGQAFDFSGSDAEVRVVLPPDLDFSLGLTLAGWLQTSGSADFSGLVDKFVQVPETTGFQVGLSGASIFPPNEPGILRGDLGVGATYVTAFNLAKVDDGRPHHFALTCDHQHAILYVDGVPGLPVATVGWIPDNSEDLVMGRDAALADRHFVGQLDDVTLHAHALTMREVQILAGHPILDIAPAQPGFVRLSWPSAGFGYRLQYSDTLEPSTWRDSPDASLSPLILPVSPTTRFFRLAW